MHAWMRAAAALLLIMLEVFSAACAWAQNMQNEPWLYGGRGEDRLLEMTQAGGGFFAVGTTMSSDGDLSVRTRTGSAGWALLADETGRRLWSYASAHTGLSRMICPSVLGDGRYALVLTDEEAQRAEWLILDDRGRLLSRVPVSPQALGLSGAYEVLAYLPGGGAPAALSLLLKDREQGALIAVSMDEGGAVNVGTPFFSGLQGVPASDEAGNIAWAGVSENGGLAFTWLDGGEAAQSCGLSFPSITAQQVCGALLQDDSSVVCCGRAEEGGFAVRVSREGEALFAQAFDCAQQHICPTENGYALYAQGESSGSVTFMDEDGAVLDTVEGLLDGALDLCGAPGGALLLGYQEGHRQKQAIVARVAQREALPSAETQRGEAYETYDAPQMNEQIGMNGGYLLCESEGFGVQVRCMDAQGREVFCTRTPIHTAADALEWCCAARLADGSIVLGGRYLFGTGDDQHQQGVAALLDSQGVLRSMETIEGAGAVCGIAQDDSGGVTLHIASGEEPGLAADAEWPYLSAGR